MVTIISVFALIAALLALVAGALALVGMKGVREPVSKVDGLVEKTEALEARVAALEQQLAPKEPKKAPEPPKKKGNPWDDFLADYNTLAVSIDASQTGQEACDRFFALRSLKGIICLDPSATVEGKAAPKFVEVAQAGKAAYWAYAVEDMFAVVPNPIKGYTKTLHEKGGMKETFASNFDEVDKDVPRIQVKLPAIFTHDNGTWIIAQPGIVKLLDE